jgi:hypothetical protein
MSMVTGYEAIYRSVERSTKSPSASAAGRGLLESGSTAR